jgi:hypothetical protein
MQLKEMELLIKERSCLKGKELLLFTKGTSDKGEGAADKVEGAAAKLKELLVRGRGCS